MFHTVLHEDAESKLNVCMADKENLQKQLKDLVLANKSLKKHEYENIKKNSKQQHTYLEVSS